MRILYARPVQDERGGNTCVGTVDVELNDDVRLYGLRLMRMRDGNLLLFAPQAGARRTATFSVPLAQRLTRMAMEALRVAA